MEWWVYLLVFLVIIFSMSTIYFSFIYPHKLKRQKLETDLKKRPHKIVLTAGDVNKFLSFKFNDIETIVPSSEYQQNGVFGFYVDKKIRYDDEFYPIYLQKAEVNIWSEIVNTKKMLEQKDPKFESVYQFLEYNNLSLDKIRFFIIEDYNIANFDYWSEVLETQTKGFNKKIA